MGDRLPIRDRTLILRILVPGLEQRLRDKMKEVEDDASNNLSGVPSTATSSNLASNSSSSSAAAAVAKETLLDLDGVMCEPTQDASTLWNFHCDGATYPARLVNLPCPVELHKTHDHAMYYKCCDVAQMLIVYEDSMALDEADAYPKTEGYPTYYHSGITTPLKHVVERRFAMREHQPKAPPRNEVSDVERDLLEYMNKISRENGNEKNIKRIKIPSLAAAQHQNKVLEEVVEDVVDYEPWMDDYGRQPTGIEFDATDQIATVHPEIWLPSEKIRLVEEQELEREEEERKKKEAASVKKQKKKKKKEKAAAAAAAAAAGESIMLTSPSPTKKKGIASKKTREPPDEITAAALGALMNAGDADGLEDDDALFDLGFDMDDLDMEGLGL